MRLPTVAGTTYHATTALSWVRRRGIKALNDWLPNRPTADIDARVSFRAKCEGVTRNIRISAGAAVRELSWLSCLDHGSSIEIAAGTMINPYAKLLAADGGKIRIGRNCTIHSFDVLYGFAGGLTIGDHVHMAVNVTLVTGDYAFDDLTRPMFAQGSTSRGITIGSHVWLGAGAIVVDGVTIGDGAVIGAGSVVTRDVPANMVCIGVPGRCIRQRGQSPDASPSGVTSEPQIL
jgi:acetyltransferase-like isoleucine patch superfamily enzyme